MMPIAMLVLMGVDPIQILVPALSTIVALSFVFAPSLQQFVTCLVFVLVQHPFDVGDVVRDYDLCGVRVCGKGVLCVCVCTCVGCSCAAGLANRPRPIPHFCTCR